MSRYIDADRLVAWCQKTFQAQSTVAGKAAVNEFLTAVDSCPTADVVEVRHGEWVFGKLGGRDAWVCSLCGAGFTGENAEWIAKEHDFCPKCGAKMDGERSENGTN